MPLESTLRDALEKEIEAEVDTIRQRARQQGETLVKEAKRWSRECVAEASRRLDEECALHVRRTLSRKELEQRNALLRLKQEELDRIFELVAGRVADMRKKDIEAFQELMTRIYENCRNLLPEERTLRVRLGSGLEGLRERLVRSEEVSVEGDDSLFGLVIEADEGRLHCDGTIPRLLQRIRREREAELEAILFGRGGPS